MPTYEYACLQCGHRVEVFRRLTDDPLTICDECGGALRKVFHPAGILFKGSGFYTTDNRSKEKAGAESGAPKNEAEESDSSSKKAPEKPAEKKPADGKAGRKTGGGAASGKEKSA